MSYLNIEESDPKNAGVTIADVCTMGNSGLLSQAKVLMGNANHPKVYGSDSMLVLRQSRSFLKCMDDNFLLFKGLLVRFP